MVEIAASAETRWDGIRILPGILRMSTDRPLVATPGRGCCIILVNEGRRMAAGVLFTAFAQPNEVVEILSRLVAGFGEHIRPNVALVAIGAPGFPRRIAIDWLRGEQIVPTLVPVGRVDSGQLVFLPRNNQLLVCPFPDEKQAPALAQPPLKAGDGLERFLTARPSLSTTATCFFRDREVFRAMIEEALPAGLARNADIFSMWNPGCSVGAETYSMAMAAEAFLEARGRAGAHVTYGTDVNEENIAIARLGKYPAPREGAFDGRMRAIFLRHMDMQGGGAVVTPELRARVRFGLHDVRTPPRKHRFHFINCNHVLQYYVESEQRAIIGAMLQALERGGFIYLHGVLARATEGLPITGMPGYRWLFRGPA